METNVIIMLISYLIFFAMFIAMPFRQKKIIQQAGNEVLKIHKKMSAVYVLVFMLGFLIIAISVINNFSIVMQSVFCACALLGEEIAMREFMFSGRHGLYENGFILGGMYVPYNQIRAFPVLALPKDEQENYDKTSLVISTEKRGNVSFPFADEEECKKVTEKLFEINPQFSKLI